MSVTITSLKNVIYKPLSGEWGDGEGETNILRTTNFTNDGKLNLDEVVTRNIELKKISQKQLKYGDTIIEKSGGSPNQPVGRVVYFDQKEGVFLCNNFTSVIRGKSEIDKRYLFWFLFNNHLTKNTLKYQNKTTGIINLQLERYIEEIQIPLPPLHIQKQIAQILDTADALKRKDQQLLKKYDELAQAIFIDMFGDPVKNEKGWEVLPCEDIFTMKLGKMLSAKNYKGTHLKKYLRNVNVKWGQIDFSDLNEMDFNDEECVSYELKKGDILVCEGGEVGRTSVFDNYSEPIFYQNALHRLRIKDDSVMKALYFEKYMEIAVSKGLIRKEIISVTIQHFSLEKFRKLKIIIPPINLQEQFVKKLINIKSQIRIIYNNENTDIFNSLLQKAFNNELVTE